MDYIINSQTQAITIIDSGYYRTKIYEENKTLYKTETPLTIIKNSCVHYGSSLEGRQKLVKKLLRMKSKLPVPIEPHDGLFFVPTKSHRNEQCTWFSYYHVKQYVERNNKLIVFLNNNQVINVDVSLNQFDLQMKRMSQVIAYFYQLIFSRKSTIFV